MVGLKRRLQVALELAEVAAQVLDAEVGEVVLAVAGDVVDEVVQVAEAVVDGRGGQEEQLLLRPAVAQPPQQLATCEPTADRSPFSDS
jgi:hypothetical protein